MNANWLICFALVVSSIYVVECKGGRGGGGRSHGGSHGRGGSSRGSHSSSSHGSSSSSRGSSSSGSHTYPQSPGISGTGTGGSHTYPKSPGNSGHGSGSRGSHTYPASNGLSGSGSYHAPSYYSSPQHVYVTQYRNSGSRYNDILTGLTLYNLGRSHGHYHNHYYHDSYYRSSPDSHSGQYAGDTYEDPNKDEATCFLKMRKNQQEEVVKVPCAIVSTFSNGNNTSDINQNNVTFVSNCSSVHNVSSNENDALKNNNTISCVNSTTNVEDPLSVRGAPIDAENMECSVEIRTKESVIQNEMDCEILLKYAKMPVPEKKAPSVLPAREKLKAMMEKPPWWLSLFIAA